MGKPEEAMEAAEIAGLSATRSSSSSRAIPAAPTALLLLRSRRRESNPKTRRPALPGQFSNGQTQPLKSSYTEYRTPPVRTPHRRQRTLRRSASSSVFAARIARCLQTRFLRSLTRPTIRPQPPHRGSRRRETIPTRIFPCSKRTDRTRNPLPERIRLNKVMMRICREALLSRFGSSQKDRPKG